MPSKPVRISSLEDAFKVQSEKLSPYVNIQVSAISTPERLETPEDSEDEKRYLVVSPYTERQHLLDLDSVNAENQLLALALVHLTNVRDDYRTAPYADSFNWPEVMAHLCRLSARSGNVWRETTFYIVAFRSQIKPDTTYSHLGELDKHAHIEATASGGFLKYWFGEYPDDQGHNLATCVWTSREHATRGNIGPAHRKAMKAAPLYAWHELERYELVVRQGVESWSMTRLK